MSGMAEAKNYTLEIKFHYRTNNKYKNVLKQPLGLMLTNMVS